MFASRFRGNISVGLNSIGMNLGGSIGICGNNSFKCVNKFKFILSGKYSGLLYGTKSFTENITSKNTIPKTKKLYAYKNNSGDYNDNKHIKNTQSSNPNEAKSKSKSKDNGDSQSNSNSDDNINKNMTKLTNPTLNKYLDQMVSNSI